MKSIIKSLSPVLLFLVAAALPLSAATIPLISEGATWTYRIGTNEASNPTNAWRFTAFNDSSWNTGATPIGYTDFSTVTGHEGSIATPITPTGIGVSLYLRKKFTLTSVSNLTHLNLTVWVDDGAVAWINGVEVRPRINVPEGELGYSAVAIAALEEQILNATFTNISSLVVGENVLAIHALNSPSASSDFFAEAALTAFDDTEGPTVIGLIPPAGSTNATLSVIEVGFSEPVTGVDAADLLINNVPASSVSPGDPGEYIFTFPQPATGTVQVTWALNHGIADLAPTPHPFAGGSWTYVLDPSISTGQPLLNEFMADNDNTLNDEDGDDSDWIEIHNPGTSTLNLGGWMLRDSGSTWHFPPGVSIPANGYLIVFASGKDKTNITGKLHTNFGLNDSGEYLGLLDPMTNAVSEFSPYPAGQLTDVSYGRDASDPRIVGFFVVPTPGARNQASGPGFAPEVKFSRPSGTFVVTQPFALTLTLGAPVSGAQIRYAFGTNVPGPTSNLYTGPIQITNTTLIRARAFAPGLLAGPITSQSYIALANVTNVINFNSHLPIMILHNYGQGPIPDNNRDDRHMIVQTFEPGFGRSSMTNPPVLAEFGIYHPRGSSTLNYAKESWFMEVQDEFRDGKNVSMFGLPDESDWVFYAPNNFDPPLFHNPLAMQLAQDQGEYASRTKFVEVYYKDDAGAPGPITAADYNGIYVLMEKIKRDDNRVDVARLEREHNSQPQVSGGYMLSIDRGNGEPVFSAGGGTMNWIDPSGFEMANIIRAPQSNYIRNYFNNFNAALQSATLWTNPVTGYAAYIDVNSWVRRHVHEVVTHNIDALRLSGYFYKDRGKKIEYGPAWDYDRTQGNGYGDSRGFNPRQFRSSIPDFGTDYFNFSPWWNRLFQAPDFWQAWIDKYQELRDGPLSMQNISNRIEQFASEIRPAHAREVARWNIQPRSGSIAAENFTHNFGTAVSYENEVRWKHVWYSNRLDYIDGQLLARPTFSYPGGQIFTGFSLTITPASKAGSWLFYTLDGTDPRTSGGGFSASALSNSGPVTVIITNNVQVFARSWNPTHANVTGPNNPPISSRWSGKTVNSFYTHIPPLRITEIMYHPQPPPTGPYLDEDFEYIELRNISGLPLNIQGYKISGGVDFVFPNTPAMILSAGQRVLVVRNRAAFQQRYGTGTLIAGEYTNVLSSVDGTSVTNSLENAGERLVLKGRLGEPILDFEYDDEWYPITDGFGFSLVIINENNPDLSSWALKESWRLSGALNGSPGSDDPAPPSIPPIVINEALTHTDPPPPTDSIELHNPTGASVNIGGWFLTDDFREPKKYRIANNTMIGGNDFIVFNESHFNTGANSFALNSLGEEVFLFSGDANTNLTGYVHGFDFGPAENGVTFGRHVISTGEDHFPPQATPTLGGANAGPKVGPIVISEIMYHPPDIQFGTNYANNTEDEYIELHNISINLAPLYHPSYPSNTWRLRDAVEFDFPTNVSLPANGRLLIVGFDPADTNKLAQFRTRNNVAPAVPVYGPFSGNLDNGGDSVELRKPDRPELFGPPNFGLVPSLLVERVRYSNLTPWPVAANGLGPSLQRIVASAYGNDPSNWVAAAKSPGGPSGGGVGPTITSHPTNKAVVAYMTATFTVGAGGPNLSYQWLFNGGILSGATNPTLTLSNVQPDQAGQYQAVVLNPSGSVASSNATLTVLVPPNILQQPASVSLRGTNGAANYGQTFSNATFTIVASSSTPISYRWRFNGMEIPGATNSSLVISNVTLVNEGLYDVIAMDSVGPITSEPARLSVLINPLITLQPLGATVGAGSQVTFSVTARGHPLPFGYRWRRNGILYTFVSTNSTNATLTLNNVSNLNAGAWTVVVTNQANTTGAISTNANLTVVTPPTNQVAPVGGTATFTVFATNTPGSVPGYQ